jgi:glycosyltransferase involved in cell wall biosynthesis
VHGECAITKHHVVESGGGLYFSSAEDFAGVTRHLLQEQGLRERFAAYGRRYVESNYSWESVLSRFDQVVGDILGRSEESCV